MNFFKNVSINKKLVLSFLFLALVPLVIVGIYSTNILSSTLKSHILKNEQNKVETKALAVSGFLRGIETDLFVLSNTTALISLVEGIISEDPDEIQFARDELGEFFKSFAESKKIYMQVRFLGSDGKEVVRVDSDGKTASIISEEKLQNKSKSSYFQNTMKLNAREVYISPLNLNKEKGKVQIPPKPVIRYAIPIFDGGGKKQGIVVLNVLAVNFLSEYKKTDGGNIYLINSDGYYLAHADQSKEFGFMFNKSGLTLAADYQSFGEKIIAARKSGVIEDHPKEILTYTPIFPDKNNPRVYWMAILGTDKSLVFKPVNALKTTLIVIILVTAGIIGFLSFYIARSISNPINNIIGELNESSDQVSSASGQISASSQELASGATEQAASLQETSSALEEMATQTNQNAENAENANHLAIKTRTAAENGAKSMADMQGAMKEINNSSEKISKIIKVIEEIAFQTNLLALNAAVEAARAGEAGKGFAVVAEEVRNLAQRSATAAKDTASLIEESVSRAENGNKIVDQAGKVLTEIVSNVKTMADLVSQISNASKEQADGVDQVNKAVAQMDKVTQSNASNAEETAASSEELAGQSEGLKNIVTHLIKIVGGTGDGSNHRPVVKKATFAHQTRAGALNIQRHPAPVAKPAAQRTLPGSARKSKQVINPDVVIPMDGDDFKDF